MSSLDDLLKDGGRLSDDQANRFIKAMVGESLLLSKPCKEWPWFRRWLYRLFGFLRLWRLQNWIDPYIIKMKKEC